MANKQTRPGVKIISALGLLAVLGAGGYYLYASRSEAAQEEQVAQESLPMYYEMRPLVVNVSAKGSKTRYLKIRPTLVVHHRALFDQLPELEPLVRSSLLSLYSNQSVDELLQPSGFEWLRNESLHFLQETLQEQIGVTTLSDVLFTEYVIQ